MRLRPGIGSCVFFALATFAGYCRGSVIIWEQIPESRPIDYQWNYAFGDVNFSGAVDAYDFDGWRSDLTYSAYLRLNPDFSYDWWTDTYKGLSFSSWNKNSGFLMTPEGVHRFFREDELDELYRMSYGYGDADGNGDIDGADVLKIQRGLGAAVGRAYLEDSQYYSPPGDFSFDGFTNAFDLTMWELNRSSPVARADGDKNGVSDGADLLLWQRSLGLSKTLAAAVPEPSTLAVASTLTLSLGALQRQSRRASRR